MGPGGLDEDGTKQNEKEGNLLGLPESEMELDVSELRWAQQVNMSVFSTGKPVKYSNWSTIPFWVFSRKFPREEAGGF